jgi:hypothetical protein
MPIKIPQPGLFKSIQYQTVVMGSVFDCFHYWALLGRYDADSHEQYSRRDNIRIIGVREEKEENETMMENAIIHF